MADGAEGESGGGELLAGLGGGITGHGGDWHGERLGDLKGAARRRVGTSLALGKPVQSSAVWVLWAGIPSEPGTAQAAVKLGRSACCVRRPRPNMADRTSLMARSSSSMA